MVDAWLFPCPVLAHRVLFSCWGPSSSACGGTPVGWFCPLPSSVWQLVVSPLAFLEEQRRRFIGGAGLAVEVCVFLLQSSTVCPPLLSDACPSHSVVGSALVEVFRFFLRKGVVGPVVLSRLFCLMLAVPRRQMGGVRFFSFLLGPVVGSVVLSVGVAQAFSSLFT